MLYRNLQRDTSYVTYNDSGEKVVNAGGKLVNEDGTLHAAYAGAPGTLVHSLIAKQKRGTPLTAYEQDVLRRYYATNPTAGLASIDDLGGNHNGGILTKAGTSNKSAANVRQGGNVWARNTPGEFARLNR